MIETLVIEFERVTKYPITNFFQKVVSFFNNSYPEVQKYYGGISETIDNEHLTLLDEIDKDCKDLLAQFKNFSNKLNSCGYWELMEYINNIQIAIEKTKKLPKFFRTSLTKRGYKPYIQVSSSVGNNRTMEDVADAVREVNRDNTQWVDLMHGNDMHEYDWEIDELTSLNVFVNNRTEVVVSTILDQPIGKRVYGRDILRKITISDNDLKLVEYQDNVEQKCNILLELTRRDIPEYPLMGKNIGISDINQFSYPMLVSEIQSTFMQNDLFQYVNVTDISLSNGDLSVTVDIKTKYDYKTEKKVVI